jgi:hypothetical protein
MTEDDPPWPAVADRIQGRLTGRNAKPVKTITPKGALA